MVTGHAIIAGLLALGNPWFPASEVQGKREWNPEIGRWGQPPEG